MKYTPPKLTRLGALTDLTLGPSTQGPNDSFEGKTKPVKK